VIERLRKRLVELVSLVDTGRQFFQHAEEFKKAYAKLQKHKCPHCGRALVGDEVPTQQEGRA
jgi:rubrerythrin